MKTEQIMLVILINETGSISAAARAMMHAQSNASKMLTTLEDELGYRIFERTHNGMMLTPEGEEFLQYAKTVQRSLEGMMQIAHEEPRVRLAVISYAYPFTERAFAKTFSRKLYDRERANLSLKLITMIEEAVMLLNRGHADVAVLTCYIENFRTMRSQFIRNNLDCMVLGQVPLYAVFSKDHPLAKKDGIFLNDLSQYPCITNDAIKEGNISTEVEKMLSNTRIRIQMRPGEGRYEIMRNSDAYVLCTPYSREELVRNNLTARKVPGSDRYIVVLTKNEKKNDEIFMDFAQNLKEEYKKWVETL